MKKENLMSIFDTAILMKNDIAVEITVPGQKTTDVIVTRKENLENKLEFYKKAYDENGFHCMNSEIKIVDAWCINFFEMYDQKSGPLFTNLNKEGV